MLNKIAKVIVGIELAGCAVMAVWGYGKAQYYKRAYDAKKELNKTFDEYHEK